MASVTRPSASGANAENSYDYPDRVLGGYLSLSADYHYQTKYLVGEISNEGFQTVDSRLSFSRFADGKLTLSVFARNLFNERYVLGSAASASGGGASSFIIASPRVFGGSARVNF
jgi:outer membrane receptor protein involved in Fe transport